MRIEVEDLGSTRLLKLASQRGFRETSVNKFPSLCFRLGANGRRRVSAPICEINTGDPPAGSALPLLEPGDPISTSFLGLPFARSTVILFRHFALPGITARNVSLVTDLRGPALDYLRAPKA